MLGSGAQAGERAQGATGDAFELRGPRRVVLDDDDRLELRG
jgi:hypothetical protein